MHPCIQESENCKKQKQNKKHVNPKNENHCTGVLDSLNEVFWCTDYNTKNPSSLWSPIPEKIKKNCKKLPFFGFFSWFFKKWHLAGRWGSLRCNQCIKTLHLSYQTSAYNDFHFLAYNGFLQFFRPLVARVKRNFFILKKYFQFSNGIRHIKTPGPETVWNSPPSFKKHSRDSTPADSKTVLITVLGSTTT